MTDDAKRIWQWEEVCELRTMERDIAMAGRDEAKRDADEMADMSKRCIARENRLQIERDEAHESLGRVVEALAQATSCGWDRLRLEAEIRSSLPPTTRGKWQRYTLPPQAQGVDSGASGERSY